MSKERDLLRRCVVWLAVASDSGIVNKDEVGIPTPNADACFSLEREITALLDSPTEADGKAISLLRAWVAGCGDEHFSTKEQVKALIDASATLLAWEDSRFRKYTSQPEAPREPKNPVVCPFCSRPFDIHNE